MKDYTRNKSLYSRLLAAARHDKLPILDNKTFESMNAEYGKEDMRKKSCRLYRNRKTCISLKRNIRRYNARVFL